MEATSAMRPRPAQVNSFIAGKVEAASIELETGLCFAFVL